MTDTAIPIPANLGAVMAPRVQTALEAFRRAWAPVVRELGRSGQRRRVRSMVPTHHGARRPRPRVRAVRGGLTGHPSRPSCSCC